MPKHAPFWAAFWTAAGLLFWNADKLGFSLCSVVRWLFRTHTREGRTAFYAALGTGTVILGRHIVKPGDWNAES